MTTFTLDDLAALPPPEIIEEIDFEAILAAAKARMIASAADFGLTYDTASLETDPAVIVAQAASYREVLLRARGNDIARDNYLYFSAGAALDHHASFYDVVRMAGESDDRLKLRVVLAVQGRSTGGTAPRYRGLALGADLRVADAVVYRDALTPLINVAVFAADNNGVADSNLLSKVEAALDADAARMVNDTIVVRSAVVSVVPVTAALTLLPNADASIAASLAASLADTWRAEGALGRDLKLDWLKARLMAAGVYGVSITAPAADVVMQPFEAVRIGDVSISVAGRAF